MKEIISRKAEEMSVELPESVRGWEVKLYDLSLTRLARLEDELNWFNSLFDALDSDGECVWFDEVCEELSNMDEGFVAVELNPYTKNINVIPTTRENSYRRNKPHLQTDLEEFYDGSELDRDKIESVFIEDLDDKIGETELLISKTRDSIENNGNPRK